MTVIRRLDAVLEPAKDAVLAMKAQLDKAGVANQHAALCQASGEAFYNTSHFRLRDLASRARRQQLKSDFKAYLDGFSPNVQEVLDKFKFRNQIPTLIEADVLGFLIEKFLDPAVNLSPKPVLHQDGSTRLPGLDNHSMGTIFEELIRRFNEENNEEAGEHFTPRDVVELMTYLIFMPIADAIQSGTYLVYDGACGTGGMLTVAEETLVKLAADHGKEVSVHLYGQEVNPASGAAGRVCGCRLIVLTRPSWSLAIIRQREAPPHIACPLCCSRRHRDRRSASRGPGQAPMNTIYTGMSRTSPRGASFRDRAAETRRLQPSGVILETPSTNC